MDLLPTVNEGDERVSLGDVLLQRDGCLSELELWAVCRECCLALQGVHVSSDMFQTLCVTPDSVAFDTCGTVCFLDLAAGTEGLFIHPEPMYVPPEYESIGNSYKAHLFSLGMTLLFAAEYNVSMSVQRPFSADLGQTINKMTLDDFEERADLAFVLDMCSRNLGDQLSDDICSQLAASVQAADASFDDGSFCAASLGHSWRSPLSPRKRRNSHSPPTSAGSSPKSSRHVSPTAAILEEGERLDSCSASPSHSLQLGSEEGEEDEDDITPRGGDPTHGHAANDSSKVTQKGDKLQPCSPNGGTSGGGGVEFTLDAVGADVSGLVSPRRDASMHDLSASLVLSEGEPSPFGGSERHRKYLPDLKQFFPDLLPDPERKLNSSQDNNNNAGLLDAADVSLDLTLSESSEPSSPVAKETNNNVKPSDTADASLETSVSDKTSDSNASGDIQVTNYNNTTDSASLTNVERKQETFDKDKSSAKSSQPKQELCQGMDSNMHSSTRQGHEKGKENGEDNQSENASLRVPINDSKHRNLSTAFELRKENLQDDALIDNMVTNQHKVREATEKSGGEVLQNLQAARQERTERGGGAASSAKPPLPPFIHNRSSKLSALSQLPSALSPSSSLASKHITSPPNSSIVSAQCSDSETQNAVGNNNNQDSNHSNVNIIAALKPTTSASSQQQQGLAPPSQLASLASSHDLKATETTQVPTLVGSVQLNQQGTHSDITADSAEAIQLDTDNKAGKLSGATGSDVNKLIKKSQDKQAKSVKKDTNVEKDQAIKLKSGVDNSAASHKADQSVTESNKGESHKDSSTRKTDTKQNLHHHHHHLLASTTQPQEPVTFNELFGSRLTRDTSSDTFGCIRDDSDILLNSYSSSESLNTSKESVLSGTQGSNPPASGFSKNSTSGATALGASVLGAKDSATSGVGGGGRRHSLPLDIVASNDPLVEGAMKGMDMLSGSTSLKRRVRDRQKAQQQKGQSVLEVLERLGMGLHETEVWALCRECVLAMQRNRLDLPAYISTETAVIEDSGRVTYRQVPDDKQLDLQFVAPELQQYGVVTEKSCLYGLATMLYSTADFGLSPDHEPLLSNELESLLLSMTNEIAEHRPTAIDVLQVCNEFQKKQETTSTKICQNLAAEARKAGEFDKKNNRLVQDIIEEDAEVQVKNHKAQVMHSILKDQPQARLKPASEREIAKLVKEPTLHERLMGQIQKPPRKLRKTSRPRVMTVHDLYRGNPDLLRDLQRVTGKRHKARLTPSPPPVAHSDAPPQQHIEPSSEQLPVIDSASPGLANAGGATSAFTASSGTVVERPGSGAFARQSSNHSGSGIETGDREGAISSASQGSIPDAFKSKATHFTPIIVTEDIAPAQPTTGADVKAKMRTAKEEENVAQKIKQLKKNLLKNRPPINLAQDLENDVLQEEETERHVVKPSEVVPKQTRPSSGSDRERSSSQSLSSSQTRSAIQTQSPMFGQVPNSVSLGQVPTIVPLGQVPTSVPFGQVPTSTPLQMGSLPSGLDAAQLAYMQQQQQQLNSGSMGKLHTLGAPLSYPGMGGPFSYQIQLHQDPHTGLFQLIPVPMPSLAYQHPPQTLPMPPRSPGHLMHMNYAYPHTDRAKSQPMSPYSGSSTDGEKPERVRHPRKKPTNRRAMGKPRTRHSDGELPSKSSSSSSSRSFEGQQDQARSSYHRLDDMDDLTDTQNSNGMSGKSSDLSPVFEHRSLRPQSDEVANIEGSGSSQPRTVRNLKQRDLRNKLKRAKSGSSVDYRHMLHPLQQHIMEPTNTMKSYKIYDDAYLCNKKLYSVAANLSRSHPNLDSDLLDAATESESISANDRDAHAPRAVGSLGKSKSPSMSPDSGVSGMGLVERRLQGVASGAEIQRGQRLLTIVRLLREEFAYDGFLEGGLEEQAMAEFILSLGSLKFGTFSGAITEKYEDLYFGEDLMTNLYDAVNGRRPVAERRCTPHSADGNTVPGVSPAHPADVTIKNSAFRPINDPRSSLRIYPNRSPHSSTLPHHVQHDVQSQEAAGSLLKPKAVKYEKHGDWRRAERERVSTTSDGKSQLDKGKSSSLHDLLREPGDTRLSVDITGLYKARSQETLLSRDPLSMRSAGVDVEERLQPGDELLTTPSSSQESLEGSTPDNTPAFTRTIHKPSKPRLIQVRSKDSSNSTVSSVATLDNSGSERPQPAPRKSQANVGISTQNVQEPPTTLTEQQRTSSLESARESLRRSHVKAKSSFTLSSRQDSSASSTSGDQRFAFGGIANGVYRQHPLIRQDSLSSGSSGGERRLSGGGVGESRPTGNKSDLRVGAARSEMYLFSTESDDIFSSAVSLDRLAQPTTAKQYREMSRMGRGSVVYYCAEMESRMRTDVKDYAAQIDPKTKENIELKMAELDQQMMVEHRNKKKTQKYYKKLLDKASTEHKSRLATVAKQVEESINRLDFLDAAKKHLEMLHAEQWGLDPHHLYALARCPGDEPMLLAACDNPLLQYQLVRNPRLAIEGRFLQAGQPEGLMAYLFAQNALSEGYIHHFFYTYRYFGAPASLLHFLRTRYVSACRSLQPGDSVPSQVKARCLDLLQVWLEGYFTVDFRHDAELVHDCRSFLQEQALPVDPSSELLVELLEECEEGSRRDLVYPEFTSRSHDSPTDPAAAAEPLKKWESFKAALHLNAKPMKLPKSDIIKPKASALKPKAEPGEEDSAEPTAGLTSRRAEALNILEHSTQDLAQQLTLIEQELFQRSHPVHYLNSKHLGISVALLNPTVQRTQTLTRSGSAERAWAGVEADSLFVCDVYADDVILRLIEHAHNVAFWVAAEIVSASSQKTQLSLIVKFLHLAGTLQQMRNYATCVSIVDGLDNLIVRQLPVWKHLPSKCAALKEELSSLKLFLKSDSMCLTGGAPSTGNNNSGGAASEEGAGGSGSSGAAVTPRVPTIPCVLLFLIHVQQLEIGGFRLANHMYRWSKLKSIAQMIDQIRVFRQHPFWLTADPSLQQALRMRIAACCTQDLHSLAAQHPANVPRISSARFTLFKKKKTYKLDA